MWDEGSAMDCSGSKFLHPDPQGSIIAIANCWGGRIAINSYDEYGIPGAQNTGRFQYTGQAWLPELGMYYYKARIYSPTLGRFIFSDALQTVVIGIKMGAVAPTLFGAIKLLVNSPTAISEVLTLSQVLSQSIWFVYLSQIGINECSHEIAARTGHRYQ